MPRRAARLFYFEVWTKDVERQFVTGVWLSGSKRTFESEQKLWRDEGYFTIRIRI